jgi:alanyl-tRNA synthetase
MDVDKNQLRRDFAKEWEKHYKLKVLIERGFKRQKCKKCSRNFWSMNDLDMCGDPGCIGYQFIGNTPVKKKLSYIDTWKTVEDYFTKHGHGLVKSYPTVARWRDDLYFTIASISDFQPYVVNGEIDPPSNPLIIPQHCIRFPDISNVGVSGRHHTNFVMIGQHAFNTDKTGLFYWKEEALGHDIECMKRLGIPQEEIVFIEDVWAGGGNFGPSIEYFVRGLELGNCVFMQYEVTKTGNRELKTKVIDMGAGLERFAWMTTGDPTGYDVVFGPVIKNLKKHTGVKIDEKLFLKYSKISGSLNEDEVDDLEKEKERVAQKLGVSKKELFDSLEPLQALYATCDHVLTLLSAVTDGLLPSNAGGGYNLRMITRRVFGFDEEFGFNLDYTKIVEDHAQHLEYLFPELKSGVKTTIDVIEEELKKYKNTKENAAGKVTSLIKRGKKIQKDELMNMYKSHGIQPEYVIEVTKKSNVEVEMPGNFYNLVREKEKDEVKEEGVDVSEMEKTEGQFYTDKENFDATIIGIAGKYIILDQTAFYPEGGGQVGDLGEINGQKIKNVIKKAGVVLHEVEDITKFKKGQKVKGKVDLERRRTITRHHTCAHILNAAARAVLGPHVWQGGSHKDDDKAHLDITHYKKITPEELNMIELKANEYIMQNLPIKTEVLSRDVAEKRYGFRLYQGGAVPGKELRIVSVGDIDHEACGGTHQMLKTTGEIGCFKIVKRESVQDGLERIVYKAGIPAIRYIQEREAILASASLMLSVSETELPRTVERFFNEWKEQRKKLERFSKGLVEEETKTLIEEGKDKPITKVLDFDAETLREIAKKITESESSSAVLINKTGNVFCAVGKKSRYKANELLKDAVKKFGGNGGGNEQIASGKVLKMPE